jgi:uncharacterized membrane protein
MNEVENTLGNVGSTAKTGAIAGILAIVCYFGAAVMPLPQAIGNLLGFAFGPFVIVSYIGIYSLYCEKHDGALLRISCVFGIIYGAIVTSLIFIQVANNMWHNELMASAETADLKERYTMVHSAVNRVQASLDVAFDLFVTISVILLSIILLRGAMVSKIFGVTGVLVATLLLTLNLYTFPDGPYEAGLFDAGPFLGLWYAAFFIWMTFRVYRKPSKG